MLSINNSCRRRESEQVALFNPPGPIQWTFVQVKSCEFCANLSSGSGFARSQ